MAGKTTVKKKFKCEFCDGLFSSKSCQETHIQNIHNPTGVIYKCGICGKSQALKGNLKRSMGTKPTFVNIVENHLHVLHLWRYTSAQFTKGRKTFNVTLAENHFTYIKIWRFIYAQSIKDTGISNVNLVVKAFFEEEI